MSISELIEVLQAVRDGKKVQVQLEYTETNKWQEADFGWVERLSKYRVAPEPRECWRIEHPDGRLSSAAFDDRVHLENTKLVLFREVL